MKKKIVGIFVSTLLIITSLSVSASYIDPCTAPDNGYGTVNLPANCPYEAPGDPFYITDGLPPDTTIELDPMFDNFINVIRFAGGDLGGEVQQFDATLLLYVSGTGDLAGFNRILSVPLQIEVHTGPRTTGDPVQSFPSKIFRLTGELFGDPDFCVFRIKAGSSHGLPSPGHVTLTKKPDGNWSVDSFFDITYQIEFEGCPASPLDGMAGTTVGTTRIQQGVGAPPYFEIDLTGGFGISTSISNIGGGPATNVTANISVAYGIILFGGEKIVDIGTMAANSTDTIKSIVIGFGSSIITVTVTCDEGIEGTKTSNAFILLFFVLNVT